MDATRRGGCQCGALRYRVEGEPGGLAVCHCRECQRQSGSAFGMSLFVPRDAFALEQGALASFRVVCDSGRLKTCSFCPACGTRIHHAVDGKDVLSVKAGTLDDPSGLVPDRHVWAKRRLPWVAIPEDVEVLEGD